MGEALREPGAHWIADPDHDNGDCCRRSHGRNGGWRPEGSDHIHGQADELSRSLGEPFGHAIGVAIVEGDVLAFHVAEVAQSLTESVPHRRLVNDADPRDFRRLLRPRPERPRRRAAEQRDERAAPNVGHGLLLALWRRPIRSVYHTPSLPRTGAAGPWGRPELV